MDIFIIILSIIGLLLLSLIYAGIMCIRNYLIDIRFDLRLLNNYMGELASLTAQQRKDK